MQPHSPQGLTTRYIVALSTVAVLSLGGQILIQYALSSQMSDTRVVNVAGRQRMFSQRLSKSALALQVATDPAQRTRHLDELMTAFGEWDRAHRGLQFGNEDLRLPPNPSPEIQRMFDEMSGMTEAMRRAAQDVIDRAAEPGLAGELATAVQTLLHNTEPFLEGMDRIVYRFDREGEARVQRLRHMEMALFGTTLIVLLLEGFLVFRPAVQSIQRSLAQLQSAEADLEEQNRHLEQALTEAQAAAEAKSRFLANMSHELRTPVHAIAGLAEILERSDLGAEQRAKVRTIEAGAAHLGTVLNDILDFSKSEREPLVLREQPYDLHKLMDELRILFSAQVQDRDDFALEFRMARDVPARIVGDGNRMRQILFNLLSNAVKFTATGYVRLDVRVEDQSLRIVVEDSGIGIRPEHQARIFEPFQQEDDSTTRRYGGTGLGLAITQHIVRLMQGEMGVVSEPGHGARFWVCVPQQALPVELEAPAPAVVRTDVPKTLTTAPQPRILIAEDHPVNRQVIVAQLRELGLHAVAVENGAAALKLLDRCAVDLMFLDCQMSVLDGYETARRVLAASYQTPYMVALTAHAMPEDRARCLAAGMHDYQAKPLSLRTLEGVLDAWCKRAGATASPVPCLDDERLQELLAIPGACEEPLLGDLIAPFERGLADGCAKMREALGAHDAKAFAQAAHALKSASSGLGALRLAGYCDHLQRQPLAAGRDAALASVEEEGEWVLALTRTYQRLAAKEAVALNESAQV